jgi:hypothetical protein
MISRDVHPRRLYCAWIHAQGSPNQCSTIRPCFPASHTTSLGTCNRCGLHWHHAQTSIPQNSERCYHCLCSLDLRFYPTLACTLSQPIRHFKGHLTGWALSMILSRIDLPSICHQHVKLVSRPYNCLHIHNKLTQP